MRYLLRTEDLLDVLHAEDDTQLRERTLRLCQRLGYEFFVYGLQRADGLLIHSTYPMSWQRLYAEQRLMHDDPTVAHARLSCLPLIWTPETFTSPAGQQMYDAARSYSIRSGVSLSLREGRDGPAMFSLASDLPMGEAREHHSHQTLPEALLLASYFSQAAQRLAAVPQPLVAPAEPASTQTLTAREQECLRWAMVGKTSWETGQIIGCSERTVNFHIGNAMRKLGASSRRSAVAKALALQLLPP